MTSRWIEPVKRSDTGLVSDIADPGQRTTNRRRVTQADVNSSAMGLGNWTVLIVLLLLLTGAVVVASIGWSLGSGAHVSASGYVALALGVVFSMAVGVGLMTLVFYSSRKGYDEGAVLLPPEISDGD